MDIIKRFFRYTSIDTQSCAEKQLSPTTEGQDKLADMIERELLSMSIPNGSTTKKDGTVYANLPASQGYEDAPSVGFIAHLDTSPDISGQCVIPRITKHYDGKPLTIGRGTVLSQKDFPHLSSLIGKTLITASGDTLLGADDKAGIAEIMTMAETLVEEKIPHGEIYLAFTPDEEIGRGTDHFDLSLFHPDFAYTVDGGQAGEVQYENFNAAEAQIQVKGLSVHPGSAKDTMINAALLLCELIGMLPPEQTPRETSGYQGFYHLTSFTGQVSEAKAEWIIRDHDADAFRQKKEYLSSLVHVINKKYGENTASITISDQYRNMNEIMSSHKDVIDIAIKATKDTGIQPIIEPIRGGTDGAGITFMGIPCPNLGTGGFCFHGPYEHIAVEDMKAVVSVLLNIVKEVSGGIPLTTLI